MKKIVFFGHDRFSALTLKVLLTKRVVPKCIVTLPSKPQGRQQKIIPSPVEIIAGKNNLPVIIYEKNCPTKAVAELHKFSPTVGILASFGAIIPRDIIDAFPKGILVVHPSLLPQYRGTSPARQAILDGAPQTGVTVFVMDKKMDHGPIVAQTSIPIRERDDRESLLDRLFPLGGKLIAQSLPGYLAGRIKPRPQNHAKATFTHWIKKEDGKIDWSKSPAYIERFIRAMNGWPGAWTEVIENGTVKKIKILEATLENGKLAIKVVQLEGKNPVSYYQFQTGHPTATFLQPKLS